MSLILLFIVPILFNLVNMYHQIIVICINIILRLIILSYIILNTFFISIYLSLLLCVVYQSLFCCVLFSLAMCPIDVISTNIAIPSILIICVFCVCSTNYSCCNIFIYFIIFIYTLCCIIISFNNLYLIYITLY